MEDTLFDSTPQNLQAFESAEIGTQVDGLEVQKLVSPRAPAKRCRKSKVWKYFDRFTVGRKKKARCKKCKLVYSYHGTTNLKRHIMELCKHREAMRGFANANDVEFDPDVFRNMVAEALISHNLSFKFVENEKIRKNFSYLNPDVEHISRNTAKAHVIKIFSQEKENMKRSFESINGKICLTSDLWSSITSKGYMSLTAHYVDNEWVLQSKLLVFRYLPPPHDGESVGECLIALLME